MGKSGASRHAPEEVDAYLAALPDDDRAALERLRRIVHATGPGCTERVSYGIPIFRLGKDLVGISARESHCALHTMSPGLMQTMAGELADVEVSGATIHFAPGNPLPEPLVERIVRERIKELGLT
jgi:uncharacterized protein YdhG (YjbR/CyaY superfamily)